MEILFSLLINSTLGLDFAMELAEGKQTGTSPSGIQKMGGINGIRLRSALESKRSQQRLALFVLEYWKLGCPLVNT